MLVGLVTEQQVELSVVAEPYVPVEALQGRVCFAQLGPFTPVLPDIGTQVIESEVQHSPVGLEQLLVCTQ